MKRRGFTLVELLVVVAIISILATIGLSVFANARNSALDAKAKAEVKSYQTALESKYDDATSGYVAPVATDFADGVLPTGPVVTYTVVSGVNTAYCVISAALKDTNGGNCTAGAGGVCTFAAAGTKFCARNLR